MVYNCYGDKPRERRVNYSRWRGFLEIGAVNELVAREHNVRNVTEGPFVG